MNMMKTLFFMMMLVVSTASVFAAPVVSEEPSISPAQQEMLRIANLQLLLLDGLIDADANSGNIADVNRDMSFSRQCKSFAENTNFGVWGTLIVNELRRVRREELYTGTPDLIAICPAFSAMNDESKEVVWVMIINAMAHLESSCRKTVTGKGPNGVVAGLLQLHQGREQIYAPGCARGDADTPAGSFRCGIAMLAKQVAIHNEVFSRRSYWDVLRPQQRTAKFRIIQNAVKNLSICQ